MPIAEDDRGSYIFNSKDLCMIEHVPEMIDSGIASLKIEGRMKGIHYLASTVKTYREAIDAYFKNPLTYKIKKDWFDELVKVNYRGYCTGFYFGDPKQISPNYDGKKMIDQAFIGKVISRTKLGLNVEVRNKVLTGDAVEILQKKGPAIQDTVKAILNGNGQSLSFAQPGNRVTIMLNNDYEPNDLIRKRDP
jgi:putative protease